MCLFLCVCSSPPFYTPSPFKICGLSAIPYRLYTSLWLAKIKLVGLNLSCSWTLLGSSPEGSLQMFLFCKPVGSSRAEFPCLLRANVHLARALIWRKVSGPASFKSTGLSSSVDNLLTYCCAKGPLYSTVWELHFLCCSPNKCSCWMQWLEREKEFMERFSFFLLKQD